MSRSNNFQIASRIKGHSNLVRPKVGTGVVNTDNEEYQRALLRIRNSERIVNLESKMQNIERMLDRITGMLLEKNHGNTLIDQSG